MSNIDERVVKMEFDNKAFEKNASETMSTLDKLKELLKFDNVKNSFDKLTQAANKVDVSNISEGIETVNAKFSAMQVVGYTAISKITSSLMNFGKNIIGKTFGQVISGGISRAFNIEQAKFTIEGLGKDFVQLKEDINYAVSGTAYGFDEAAKAASMMAASGIEAGDQMKASLRGISGMAAMTGDSYSNIADIFGNIAGKGKLTLQEVNRFATRGINVAAKLAEVFGETEESMREMISKGQVSFEQFAAAMDEAFGEHATEANKTFTGAMSNIKASLSRVGAAFITPLIETNEKDAMLLETYKDLDRELVKIAADSNKAFENGVNARTALNNAVRESKKLSMLSNEEIKLLIDENRSGYYELLRQIPEFANKSNAELKKIYDADQKELVKILAKTPEYANKTREELQAILKTGEEQFIDQARQMEKYANWSDKDLSRLYKQYSGFQYNIVTVLQAFKRMLGAIENAISKSSFLQAFIDMSEKASKSLSYFFNAVAATFSTVEKNGKTYKQAIEVFGKKGHILRASKLWSRFAESIGVSEADIKNVGDTLKGIVSIFKVLIDIVGAVWKAFSPLLGLFKAIGSIIFLVTGTIGRLVNALYEIINSSRIIQNVATVINGVLSVIVDTINFVIDGVVSFLTFLTKNPATDMLVDSLKKAAGTIDFLFQGMFAAFGGIAFAVKWVVDTIKKEFSKIPSNPIFKLIIRTFEWIGKIITEIFGTIVHVVKQVMSVFIYPFTKLGNVFEKTGTIIDAALTAVNSVLNDFARFLKDCQKELDKFIEKYIDFDKVLETGNKVAAFLRDNFNIGNIFGETKTEGTDGMFDNAIGSTSGLEKSKKKEDKVFKAIVSGIDAFFKAISKFDGKKASKALNNIFKGLSIVFEKGIGLLDISISKLFEFLNGIDFSIITQFFIDAASFIGKTILRFVDYISKALNEIGAQLQKIDYSEVVSGFMSSLKNLFEALLNVVWIIPKIIKEVIGQAIKGMYALHAPADKLGVTLGDILADGIRLILNAIPIILRIVVRALEVLSVKLPGIFGEFGKNLRVALGKKIGAAFSSIADSLAKVKFSKILKAINLVALYGFIYQLTQIAKQVRKLLGGVTAFYDLEKALGKVLGGVNKVLQAQYIRMMIVNLLLLMGAFYIISKVPYETFINGALKMTIAVGFLWLFLKAIDKVTNTSYGIFDYSKVYMAIGGLIVALTMLVGAVTLLSLAKNIWSAVAAFGAILTIIGALLFAFQALKIDPKIFKKFADAMRQFSIAMTIMSVGLLILSLANPLKLLNSILALGIVIATLVIAAKYASDNIGALQALSSFGPAILMMSAGLAILSLFDWKSLLTATAAIAGVIITLVGAAAIAGNFAPVAAGLTLISAAISAFGTAVLMVGGGVYLFVSAMQTLAMMGQDGSLERLGAAIQKLASYISVLFVGIGEGLVAMIQTLAANASKIGDALLQILADIFERIKAAAVMFAEVGISIILTILEGIRSKIYEIASVVAQIIAQFISAVASRIGEIVEAGMNLMINFIVGMADAIKTHSEELWAAIKHLVGQIINFIIDGLKMVVKEIPFIGKDMAKGLEGAKGAIDKLFGDGTLSKDAKKEMKAAADSVEKESKIAKTAAEKNFGSTGKAAKKGAKETKGAYKGVGKSIVKEFKTVGKGADLSKQMPKMGKDTINAYQESIKKNAKPETGKKAAEKVKAGTTLVDFAASGADAAKGFAKGAASQDMLNIAYNAGYKLGNKADQGIRAALREHSPSKKTEEAGMFAGKGLVNGMAEMAMKVYRAGADMGSSALDGLRNSMSMLNLDSIDSSPTIRPVLDLSNVKMGVDSINSMFGNSPYALSLAGNMNITSHYDDLQEQNRVQSKNMDKLVSAIADNGLDPDLVYAAVREGAADATLRLNLNGRELSRGLKDLGVKFR